jgi:hypothetical protein
MAATSVPARPTTGRRSGAVFGFAFVVVLFVTAAAVSLPGPEASAHQVVAFYVQHRNVVELVQLLALTTVPLLVLFALRLRELDRASGTAAVAVAAMGSLPTVATLVLALTADPRHADSAHALNVTAAVADDLLFLTISGFAAAVWAGRSAYRPWLRGLAVVTSAVCLARGVLGLAGVQSWLDIAGPLTFVALVGALSIRLLTARGDGTAPAP